MGKSLNGKELGTGISQRKDRRYQARFINRFGNRQTIYAKTVTEITKRLREEQYQDDKQVNVISSSMTLDEWFEEWIITCKGNCRNTTLRTYRYNYNRLREELGWRKLNDLNLIVVQKVFNNLSTDNMRKTSKIVFNNMMKSALKSKLITTNFATDINIKTSKTVKKEKGKKITVSNTAKRERRVLTDKEIETILQDTIINNRKLYNFIVVALGTGMRSGEILGLTWDCINFENNTINIEKTLVSVGGNGAGCYEFHLPKTESGIREIPMTKKVNEAFKNQKEIKSSIEVKYKARDDFEDLVFCSIHNRPLNTKNIIRSIKTASNRINEKNSELNFKPFTPHEMRHTFATKAIAKGMRPKSLQKILGHSNLAITMNLYCHVESESLKEQMSLLDEMV